MKDRILQTLSDLRTYALKKGYEVTLFYQEEDGSLMRFANSAISLNTNEHLIRLTITAHDGRRRADYAMITNLDEVDAMKKGIDTAVEMSKHAMPLSYEPTVPVLKADFIDESGFDDALAHISNDEKLAYFNKVADGLEDENLKLGGIFSSGSNIIAHTNTRSQHIQFFRTSDGQVTAVISHAKLKWEVIAEQSAWKKSDLQPGALHRDLAFLIKHYQKDPALQLPLGKYDIVFGPAANAEILNYFNYIAFNGGFMRRGFSFLTEEHIGRKVLSTQFTLTDDPTRLETFPFKQDSTGIDRKPYPLFEKGVFKGFVWFQDDADEFAAKPTGHNVLHNSLVMKTGSSPIGSLQALADMPRDRDVLYIPYLHYTNLVNPSRGIFTGSSRFGNLLLKKDGSIAVPYNVRLTQSVLDMYGDGIEWLSADETVYNLSQSYGARNPTSIIVPTFLKVNALEISHSNNSY